MTGVWVQKHPLTIARWALSAIEFEVFRRAATLAAAQLIQIDDGVVTGALGHLDPGARVERLGGFAVARLRWRGARKARGVRHTLVLSNA